MSIERYFDYAGSTPVHPLVAEVYADGLKRAIGNSAAPHPEGRRAKAEVEQAREVIAGHLGAESREVYFTSGGTESNNWALLSSAALRGRGHVIVSAIEHKSVLEPVRHLEAEGFDLSLLPVDEDGRVLVDALEASMRDETFLVSIMYANNEVGTLQPVNRIAEICRRRGVLFHCDAVAALGKIHFRVEDIGCDLLSLSSHKMYAPKGCGVLYIRRGVDLPPMIRGCGQQDGMRSGTENTPGIVAFAKAFEILETGAFGRHDEILRLRERLWDGLVQSLPGIQKNGDSGLSNTLNVFFPDQTAMEMVAALGERGYSVAAGAAAAKGSASHVLTAMGMDHGRASSSLRFSLGAFTTEASVERLVEALLAVIK